MISLIWVRYKVSLLDTNSSDIRKIGKQNGRLFATHSLPLDGAQDEQLGPGLLQQRYLLSNKNDCCQML